EVDFTLAILGEFQSVEDDVIVTSFEPGNQPVPLVVNEDGPAIELAAQGLGQIDLKADDLPRILRVRKDVRGAAFRISTPSQLTNLSNRCRRSEKRESAERQGNQ